MDNKLPENDIKTTSDETMFIINKSYGGKQGPLTLTKMEVQELLPKLSEFARSEEAY